MCTGEGGAGPAAAPRPQVHIVLTPACQQVIICTHGVTLRVFLMRWFKWTVRQFEQIHNSRNCEVRP